MAATPSPEMRFGQMALDPVAIGSQGNAILGIRDSGKTYTATLLAEGLFDAGVPFIAFDPIGVWRFLRVPGAGRGYPVVVAGGVEPDLPLTPAAVPALVEAAMQNGVSLVLDLFDINLSKADWRRIVTAALRTLLHKNQRYGLRHVFIEEAAEFAPQRVIDGDVYAEMEKLARMGGNSRLGYTLINQRAEEVNKALLELCDNLFLHRQKGRNSLTALQKWLDIGNVTDARAIIDTLATLPTGECWAWLQGTDHAVRVKVPAKNSLHPDRRVMRGDAEVKVSAPVSVDTFVSGMRETLVTVEADAKANDPKFLKAEIARLKAEAAKTAPSAPDPAVIQAAEQRGYERGVMDGKVEAVTGIARFSDAVKKLYADLDEWGKELQAAAKRAAATPPPQRTRVPAPAPHKRVDPPPAKPVPAAPKPNGSGDITLTNPQQRVLEALAFWKSLGFDQPTRYQVGAAAGYSPASGGFGNILGGLRTSALIDYPATGRVSLTGAGEALAGEPEARSPLDRALTILSDPQAKVLHAVIERREAGRDEIGHATGYSPTSGGFGNLLGALRSLGLIDYPSRGMVRAADWLLET